MRKALVLAAILLATPVEEVRAGEIEADRTLSAGLVAPQRLATNAAGELIVVDSEGLVVLGLYNGEVISRLPYEGLGSVALDAAGRLLVGGRFGARLIDRDGALLRELVPSAGPLPATDVAVAVLAQRYLVLYGDAARVEVYDAAAGAFLFGFGTSGSGPGELLTPLALATSPAGEILVADSGHGRVQVYGADGSFRRSFGRLDSAPGGFHQIQGLAVSGDGLIYAADAFYSRVQVFEADGTLREVVGGYGDALGELRTPVGVALSDVHGRLAVASLASGTVQVFRLPAAATGPSATFDRQSLDFGDQLAGTESVAQSLLLANPGDVELHLWQTVLGGEFALVADGCGARLAPGGSCWFEVVFAPKVAGPARGWLTLADSAPGSPHRVALTGRGTLVPADVEPPRVVAVASVAAGGGILSQDETTDVEIRELLVSFSEAMIPSQSFRLLAAGGDGAFATTGCMDPAAGDDLAVSLDAVLYDETAANATLHINGGEGLDVGGYQLTVCATATDLAGNALDGDGDGIPGDDFILRFKVLEAAIFTDGFETGDARSWSARIP